MQNNQGVIDVNISEFRIASNKGVLRTSGIGSCMIITLYDPVKKIGGMAHSMLPGDHPSDPKYVGSAIDLMVKEMELKGADIERLEARIVGGADVLQEPQNNSQEIGLENIKSALEKLKEKNIKIVAEDIGKNHSRSVEFNLKTGKILVARL
ncbi:MAG: chemotaxis protein CheD [bacterium]|nr:chemotaxis protein CheD [bacterium]